MHDLSFEYHDRWIEGMLLPNSIVIIFIHIGLRSIVHLHIFTCAVALVARRLWIVTWRVADVPRLQHMQVSSHPSHIAVCNTPVIQQAP